MILLELCSLQVRQLDEIYPPIIHFHYLLFEVDVVLIQLKTSCLLQNFDVLVVSPLKTYFKEFLISERFNPYIVKGVDISNQTDKEHHNSLTKSFIWATSKCISMSNIR